jgi:hypothetical protein
MRSTKSVKLITAAVTGALALSLSACGGDDEASAGSEAKAAPSPAAVLKTLTGEMTEVTLNPDFVAGLTSLKVAPGVVGTAKLDATTGTLSFPITGGNATYYTPGTQPAGDPYVQGIINHDGSGLSLTAGGTKVELTNFDVDPGKSMLFGDVSANGQSVVQDAPLFFLDGRTLKPLDTSSGKPVLEGTEVKLSPEAADLLNKTYKIDALKAYTPVGIAKITLAGS